MNYNFQEGQRVAVIFHHHWGTRKIKRLTKITRVTKTLALIDDLKYNRQNGFGRYHDRIEPATPELIAEFAKQRRESERSEFLAPFLDHWIKMSEENLEKVAAALGFPAAPGPSA